jgi:hypothetical protein
VAADVVIDVAVDVVTDGAVDVSAIFVADGADVSGCVSNQDRARAK